MNYIWMAIFYFLEKKQTVITVKIQKVCEWDNKGAFVYVDIIFT